MNKPKTIRLSMNIYGNYLIHVGTERVYTFNCEFDMLFKAKELIASGNYKLSNKSAYKIATITGD